MSVQRYDLNKCIGCRSCVTVCPMDVFRFDVAENKSVLSYVENCQSCGQCFVHCKGQSLTMSYLSSGFASANYRAASTVSASQVDEYIKAQPAKSVEEAAAAADKSGKA